MTTRADVIAEARQWIGTRWHHQASVKGVGSDCVGLIGGVAVALGLPGGAEWMADPTLHSYGREPSATLIEDAAGRLLVPIEMRWVRAGDILLFRFGAEPQHFGILTDCCPGQIIHAYAQARKVVENRIDDIWRSRIVRAYAYQGLD